MDLRGILIFAIYFSLAIACLEQPGNAAVFVDVDPFCSGDFRQSGHGHHVAADGYDESRAVGDSVFTHRQRVAG